MEEAIQAWEGEGGAVQSTERRLIGTAHQVEWAMQIRAGVNAEFDRVAKVLESVASKQSEPDRRNTQAIIAILERKRACVIAKDQAGYFIRDWQEITDQVRRMIAQDSCYQALQAKRGGNSMEMKIVDAFSFSFNKSWRRHLVIWEQIGTSSPQNGQLACPKSI